MNDTTSREKSIRCSCIGGEHYIHFYYEEEDKMLWVSLNAKEKLPFLNRIKEIFRYLKGKPLTEDEVVLDLEKQKELADFILTNQSKKPSDK